MPYVDATAGELFYAQQRGPEEGPVLVLVHGAGGSRLHWPGDLRRLPGATVYTLDLPGHGRSRGAGSADIDGYVAALVTFLESVVGTPAVIVGHSMGGAVAQKLALDHEEWVASLVLIGTGARLRVAAPILNGVQQDFEATVDLVTEYAWSSQVDASLRQIGREALQHTGPNVLSGDFLACDRFDVMDRLGEIHAPTLVIVGSADRLTPPKYSSFLGEQLPNARLLMVEGAGHMVMLERSEDVVDAVRQFIEA